MPILQDFLRSLPIFLEYHFLSFRLNEHSKYSERGERNGKNSTSKGMFASIDLRKVGRVKLMFQKDWDKMGKNGKGEKNQREEVEEKRMWERERVKRGEGIIHHSDQDSESVKPIPDHFYHLLRNQRRSVLSVQINLILFMIHKYIFQIFLPSSSPHLYSFLSLFHSTTICYQWRYLNHTEYY